MHWIEVSWDSLLGRDRPLLRELQNILRVDADRGPCGTRAHTRRTALQTRAGITLDRRLGDLLRGAAPDAAQQAGLRGHLCQLDDSVGTVFHAVAAPDAGVGDRDLAVGQPVNGIGRAVLHAMRMLAVP